MVRNGGQKPGFLQKYVLRPSISAKNPVSLVSVPPGLKFLERSVLTSSSPTLNTTKINGKMMLTFDRATYSNLLAEIAPRAIESEDEYDRLLAVAERLTFAKNRSPEKRALHKFLVMLIEVYETENYPMDKPDPHEILQHIMESSGLSQADLVGIMKSSSGVVSEVVNGKRAISKAQAKALGDYFKVSPSLFI